MKRKVKKTLKFISEFFIAAAVFAIVLTYLPNNIPESSIPIQSDGVTFVLHWSATDWELFFDEYDLDEILTGETKDTVLDMLNAEYQSNDSEQDDSWNPTISYEIKNKSCHLPWAGVKIQNGQSVLAYQQRRDVPSLCNVERRMCRNGLLKWSYVQRSCKERIVYEYTKENFILYNEKVKNPYIQTPDLAGSRNENFSTEGKVNNSDVPRTVWNNTNNNPDYRDVPNIGIIYDPGNDCKTPWWDVIKNRQFIKSYKKTQWFLGNLCEVELRYCLDGTLEWNFTYPSCTHHEMTQKDYAMGKKVHDENPTPMHIIEQLRFDNK